LTYRTPKYNLRALLSICVTGHRPDKLGGYDAANPLRRAIREEFKERLLCLVGAHLLEAGSAECEVYCGMAQGFDQDAACACIQADVPFVACVPFAGQELVWTPEAQRDYRLILSRAKRVEVLAQKPATRTAAVSLLYVRNHFMIESCDVVVACWNGTFGGTYETVKYAQRLGKPLHVIDPRALANREDNRGN